MLCNVRGYGDEGREWKVEYRVKSDRMGEEQEKREGKEDKN